MTIRCLGSTALLFVTFACIGCSNVSLKDSPDTITAPPMPTAPLAKTPATAPAAPIPVVVLAGEAAEMGSVHGASLSPAIHTLYEMYLKRFIRNEMQRIMALSAAEGFEQKLLPEHRAEVEALAKQTKLGARETMLAQCFLDLTGITACSTIALPADAAPDGVARFGRNLDFPSLDIADQYTTLFIFRPKGKYAFASVGWPGLVGVLSGMNEHGLTIANMEVTRRGRPPQAMPYTLLYRTVLEQCRTTDEAVELLRSTPRQTPNNLMIMDATGRRAVAEISPEGVNVRWGDDAALISTNHRRDQDQDTTGRCARYDYLRKTSNAESGRIDVARIQAMLAKVSKGRSTLQSMVFEPSTRVLYLSAGADAARGTMQRIELQRMFTP